MKAKRMRTTKRVEQMREMLRELEGSGESVRVFCARKNISTWTVYHWRRRLREGSADRPAPDRQAALLPIRVVDGPATGSVSYEIGLRSGRTLKVMPGLNSTEVEHLLGVLERC